MPILTSYLVIVSTPFELQDDQQRTFTFQLPDGLVRRRHGTQPLLAYEVMPLALLASDAGATLTIELNDHWLVRLSVEQTILRGLWEIVPGHFLHSNCTNTLQFRLLSGYIQVANVVLWFQRQG